MDKIYHVKTQADYDALMVELEAKGYLWMSGFLPTKLNSWEAYGSDTGIRLEESKRISCESIKKTDLVVTDYVKEPNNVNSPNHYKQGKQEVIEIIEESATNYPVSVSYHIGNVIKYIMRAPFKGRMKEDLEKANWYLERAIERL